MTIREFSDTLGGLETQRDCTPLSLVQPSAVTAGWQDRDDTWRGAYLSPLMTRNGILIVDVFAVDEQGRSVRVGRLGLDPPRARLLARALLDPAPTGEEIWGETPEADLFPLRLAQEET